MLEKIVKYLIVSIVLVFNFPCASAQLNYMGYPFIENFKRSEYQAGLQSWMISQAANELIYFANNEGLMEFDGHNWKLYPVPNRTIIRSVFAAQNGKIYVGCNNNFGYFETDTNEQMHFHSMLDLLPPEEQDIEEIWKIYNTHLGIVFQSYRKLIIVENNVAQVFVPPTMFHFSFYTNNKLYVVDNAKGILEFDNGKYIPLEGTDRLIGKEICAIIPNGANLLIATTDNGVFLYDNTKLIEWINPAAEFLKKNQIYSALRIDEEHLAFGTIQSGLMICTNDGIPTLIIDEKNGLQNNTILCMKLDSNRNLWLGTDNGIDLLFIHLPFSQLNKNMGLSAGYTAAIHNDILYLGTNRGVFYKKWGETTNFSMRFGDFELIEATKGQVWKLQIIDDVLFCGHNNGTYLIDGTEAKKISDISGSWTFLHSEKKPDKIVGGTYTGLILFEKKAGQWLFSEKIEGFEESSRVMELDKDESIWISHGFKGVFHIKLTEIMDSVLNVDFYNAQHGFKSNFDINVAKLQNKIVFLSPHGIFQYNEKDDNMIPSEYFNTLFSSPDINHAMEDHDGNIWYFSGNSVGVNRIQEDGNYIEISLPFKPLQGKFIGGFQFVFPINKSHVLFGYENGFIHYVPTYAKDYQKTFNIFIRSVKISSSDSVLFNGHLFTNSAIIPDLDFKDNRLHFFFSSINFETPEKLEFSTFLSGYDEEWSKWENRQDREFTNLKEGKYFFYAKARNIYNVETEPIAYEFYINPPWTRTKTAYSIYILFLLFAVGLLIYLVQKRMKKLKFVEKQQQRQKYIERENILKQDALMAEKEIIRLKNEKLSAEMKIKNKELANSTMQTIHKNKFLISIKKRMNNIVSVSNNNSVKSQTKKLIREIDNDINNEKNWEVFELHFGNVHEEFLGRLKQQFPKISPAELRLCACLRMNISSKEIASLLNISIRGVEASRYRVRKTLNLDRTTNLIDFVL